ncbi:MAG: alpha-amylase family glycosyl hydrolase [Saccharofermentanales bacterium]
MLLKDRFRNANLRRRLVADMIAVAVILTICMTALTSCISGGGITKVSDGYRNFYEIFVRSYYDSGNDGIGDLKGVTSKLDYISKTLGADGIWMMPIMPSPSYHKYDITDYYSIDSQYGKLDDFDNLIAEAHKRDIRVIIDFVVNHTSTAHPWFEAAVKALWKGENSKYIGYYNFTTDNPGQGFNKITDKYYYECRFWSGMPDLNLDNPDLRKELIKIAKFWIDRGVDGFRLDACTSFYTGNNPKNIEFLTWLNNEIKAYKADAYLIGEVWSDAVTISDFYSSGIDSFFNFPFSQVNGTLAIAVNTKNGNNFADELANWNTRIKSHNLSAIDALFLSNHDNSRSAGFLSRNLVKEKMAAALYLLASGNPFIYYGEEIGMNGSGVDPNKRLPMLWSVSDTNGMTYPPPGASQTVEDINAVDVQIADKESLLSTYKRIMTIKAKHPEIARGIMAEIDSGNPGVIAFSVKYKEKTIYIIHNLMEVDQQITIDTDTKSRIKIADYLITGNDKPVLTKKTVSLPPASTVILE